jgi:hypothetical protein
MPPKKGDRLPHQEHPARKHSARKAAPKKHADDKPGKDKHAKKHGHSKDLRRAFEHMNRVQCLHGSLKRTAARSIDVLAALAQQELTSGEEENAADLLRAAEHLAFAFLADDAVTDSLPPELLAAIHEQFERLQHKANEHWKEQHKPHGELARIYEAAKTASAKALKEEQYHRALEFQRAAEALAHVELQPARKLAAGQKQRQLKAS